MSGTFLYSEYQQIFLSVARRLCILIMIGWMGFGAACIVKEPGDKHMITDKDTYKTGRLKARPDNYTAKESFITGLQPLNLDSKRDGLIYVPAAYKKEQPAALTLMLHGAGGQAAHGLSLLKQYADANNIILVAPSSRASSWDIIVTESFGPDVRFIDRALEEVFGQYAIDTTRMAIGGFSDGASYALCIGLSNGDLFTHILAFSPGFVYTIENTGKPAVFISHGTKDRVLPIDPCSRRIVPRLKQKGVQVTYKEFEGEHQVPAGISASAIDWFLEK